MYTVFALAVAATETCMRITQVMETAWQAAWVLMADELLTAGLIHFHVSFFFSHTAGS